MLRHKKKNLATPTEILKQSLVQYYRQDICKFFTCKRKLVFATKFFLGSIVCIGLAMLSHTASVSAATIQTAVNNSTNDYTASDTTVQFNGKTTATGITCIRINNIDMLPVKSTITALSAAYRYDEATGALTITGNGGEHRIVANVNALSATVDGTNITLPYPIIRGENITDQSADFYIPMDFYLKQLGYSYTYNNQTLSVTSSHLFAVTSPDNSYNDTVYSNAISGIILDANASRTENSIQVTTVKEMNASDLKISSDTKEYSVTMAFSGVKNGIGAYEKNIQNGIVRSIHIWEDTSMHSTYVKIYYEKKYVYTKKTLSNGGKITLSKGKKVSLTKGNPGLKHIVVGLGWDTNKYDGGFDFDLDSAAFLLGENGKVNADTDFVFYNNLKHSSGAVEHLGDNLTGEGDGDDEQVKVDLSLVPQNISKIAFTVTIHEALERRQNFGQVSNSYVRVVDEDTNQELLNYELGEDFSIETAIVVCEIYRHNGEWKFNALGSGFEGGLEALCKNFGVNV